MINQLFIVLGTSMLPVSELRGAIPVGIAGLDLPWLWVYITAVIGNMVPVLILPHVLEKLATFFTNRFAPLGKLLQWLFERTRKKFYTKYSRFGNIALILFVAVPLPVTGAWTGTLAAWLFGIPYRKTVPLIFVGVLISGAIVTLITLGLMRL